jgi:MauM/NapG family ferredoxin protein
MQEMLARGKGDIHVFRADAARNPAPGSGENMNVPFSTPRRAVLGAALGTLVAWSYRKTGLQTQPVRPPGAAGEDGFRGVCIRCGNCVRACPSHILQPDLGEHGVTSFLTPTASFEKDFCREDCNACNVACPSGAIARLSLYQKRQFAMGLAKVDLEPCLMAKGQDCTACIVQCPYEAVMREDTDGGFSSAPVVDAAKCTGCGACEAACPVRPVRAIRVVPPALPGGTLSPSVASARQA